MISQAEQGVCNGKNLANSFTHFFCYGTVIESNGTVFGCTGTVAGWNGLRIRVIIVVLNDGKKARCYTLLYFAIVAQYSTLVCNLISMLRQRML